MKASSSKQTRKELINSLTPKDFDNYYDYFYYLHLNDHVRLLHVIGMLVGLIILPFALYYMSLILFIIYFFFFYGMGFISHALFDGTPSKTASEAPWKSFIYATQINSYYLLGKCPKLDQEFLKKYPFCLKVYTDKN